MTLHERALDAAPWNKAYKHSVVRQYGIRMPEDLSLGEDLLFNYQYLDVTCPEILLNTIPMYVYTCAENETLNSKYRADLEQIYLLLDQQILDYLLKWRVDQEQMSRYYNSVLYGQERVLRNTFRNENKSSYINKIKTNTRILKSRKFRTALNNANCFIHPLYRLGYALGCWPIIQVLDKIVEIRRKRRVDY